MALTSHTIQAVVVFSLEYKAVMWLRPEDIKIWIWSRQREDFHWKWMPLWGLGFPKETLTPLWVQLNYFNGIKDKSQWILNAAICFMELGLICVWRGFKIVHECKKLHNHRCIKGVNQEPSFVSTKHQTSSHLLKEKNKPAIKHTISANMGMFLCRP